MAGIQSQLLNTLPHCFVGATRWHEPHAHNHLGYRKTFRHKPPKVFITDRNVCTKRA